MNNSTLQTPHPKLLTTQDVRRRLNCSREVVYRLVESGRLRCTDIGANRKRLRFRPDDVDAILDTTPPERPLVHVPVDANGKPINRSDRDAINRLRKRGFEI